MAQRIVTAFACAALVWLAGCVTAPPIPPRPADRPWRVGVVGGWYGATLTADEVATLATFRPLLRAPILTAAHAAAVLDQAAACCAVLLLVETMDDALVATLPPVAGRAWGIELGNELNFSADARAVGAFVARSARTLRAGGFQGRIVANGIGNLDGDTRAWLRTAMAVGWPADVAVGWHAYSDWRAGLPAFVALVGARGHVMTEWGYPAGGADEATVADWAARDLAAFYAAGAEAAVWYQIADPPDALGYGLHDAAGRWRPTLDVLRAGVSGRW